MQTNKSGFTVIELLVVIATIGIMLTIVANIIFSDGTEIVAEEKMEKHIRKMYPDLTDIRITCGGGIMEQYIRCSATGRAPESTARITIERGCEKRGSACVPIRSR